MSATEGVGSYFPAFFPDGRVFYIANSTPKNAEGPKRFTFRVVNPDRDVRFANIFQDPGLLAAAEAIGQLWRESCAAELQPFKPGEAPWAFMGLAPAQCAGLVEARFAGEPATRGQLLASCKAGGSSVK